MVSGVFLGFMKIDRIVSGGQTGADRAALDWAIEHGVAHEGWCPAGRRAEDGPIDSRYRLFETAEEGYLVRTERNVLETDATVIMTLKADLTGGSLATKRFADRHGKPCLHLSKATSDDPARDLVDFLERHDVRILNVAGPRKSGEPTVGDFVREVLSEALEEEVDHAE